MMRRYGQGDVTETKVTDKRIARQAAKNDEWTDQDEAALSEEDTTK